MEARHKWRACVYFVENAERKYWGLVAYGEEGNLRYARENQMNFVQPAWFGARDYAAMLNDNQLSPDEEGSTFRVSALPKGRFLNEDEVGVLIKSERQAEDEAFKQSILRHASINRGPKF